jgi:hypothetical protein
MAPHQEQQQRAHGKPRAIEPPAQIGRSGACVHSPMRRELAPHLAPAPSGLSSQPASAPGHERATHTVLDRSTRATQ